VKIAIAQWQGRVSPVFDVSDSLVVIDLDKQGRQERQTVTLTNRDPVRRSREVADLGVSVLICGAISQALERFLTGTGVEVNGFICGDVDGVVAAYGQGQLMQERFHMPGTRPKGRQRRVRHRAGHHGPASPQTV